MKVLHVFNEIKFSGAEIMYANAAPFFQQKGVEMIAISTGETVGAYCSFFEDANIKVIHKPLPRLNDNPSIIFRYFKSLLAFVRNENIDVIQIHRASYYWCFAFIGFSASVKVIRTIHNVFKNRTITRPVAILHRFMTKKLLRVCFHTIGKSVHDNELFYYKNQSVRINNWYNNKKFFPAQVGEEKRALRSGLNIPLNAFVIISTGACTHIKNHTDILSAIPLYKGLRPILYLHLGEGYRCEEEMLFADSLGITHNIRFEGNKINVRDYLVASDVYIMTSKFEGLSIGAIEAMACGIPLVLYDAPGLRDLIDNDNNGFLIAPNSNILAEKLSILSQNNVLASSMGRSAFESVNKEFSMEIAVDKLINLYKTEII